MKIAKTTLAGWTLTASLAACTASTAPQSVETANDSTSAGDVKPEFYYGPTCLTTSAEATLDFANGPFVTASPNASYTAAGCANEYVVQLNHLDVAWAENYKAGTSLYFKEGAFPSNQSDCVNARLVATVYAYEGGSWIAEGKIAMHGHWVYSGGWSCAPQADSAGSGEVFFNPVFGFSAGRVVAKAYVLPYGAMTGPRAIPLGVDLY